MASPLSTAGSPRELHRYACSLCARRKVKCDKVEPCTNCIKAHAQCIYHATAPQRRPRKRAGDDVLMTRLAQYEELLRKHNVDFSNFAHTWVPPTTTSISTGSASEDGLRDRDMDSDVYPQTPVSIISGAPNSCPSAKTPLGAESTSLVGNKDLELCLWSNLSPELKYPLIHSLRHKYDPLRYSSTPFQFSLPSSQPEADLSHLHPDPRYIIRLWQIFVERVHPVTKIVHVPTLQQRILDASWDCSKASPSLTALMFVVYSLAITPMSTEDCHITFGETRDTLLMRYRSAAFQALVAADFLTTKDLEVLQAFALFLFSDPESELTYNLAGAALRVGQRMGIHRDTPGTGSPKVSFFEREMGIRLWWQLRCIDSRSRVLSMPGVHPLPAPDYGHVRLPLNANDADLHPDMIGPPVEHTGPTEMLCVLIKFEVLQWLRTSVKAAKAFNSPAQILAMELDDEAIGELEAVYQQKYFGNFDSNIPLHKLAHAVASFTIARMRFKIHHHRCSRATAGSGVGSTGNGEIYIARGECDLLFNTALTVLEKIHACIHNQLSSHLYIYMTLTYQLDLYIYVIRELRRGDQRWGTSSCERARVDLAWRLVEDLYNEHPEIIHDPSNPLFTAFNGLTLEAWDIHQQDLVVRGGPAGEPEVTPRFVQLLWGTRRKGKVERDKEEAQMPAVLESLGLTDEGELNWDYWNDFLQL
ncbi:hypothetical protein BX600DRAFT_513979 [Xylariales sp. PMI_506]|nr:hypothetical protein BX600DRAFT_513979 [Xylariales sp. PMI_506]